MRQGKRHWIGEAQGVAGAKGDVRARLGLLEEILFLLNWEKEINQV